MSMQIIMRGQAVSQRLVANQNAYNQAMQACIDMRNRSYSLQAAFMRYGTLGTFEGFKGDAAEGLAKSLLITHGELGDLPDSAWSAANAFTNVNTLAFLRRRVEQATTMAREAMMRQQQAEQGMRQVNNYIRQANQMAMMAGPNPAYQAYIRSYIAQMTQTYYRLQSERTRAIQMLNQASQAIARCEQEEQRVYEQTASRLRTIDPMAENTPGKINGRAAGSMFQLAAGAPKMLEQLEKLANSQYNGSGWAARDLFETLIMGLGYMNVPSLPKSVSSSIDSVSQGLEWGKYYAEGYILDSGEVGPNGETVDPVKWYQGMWDKVVKSSTPQDATAAASSTAPAVGGSMTDSVSHRFGATPVSATTGGTTSAASVSTTTAAVHQMIGEPGNPYVMSTAGVADASATTGDYDGSTSTGVPAGGYRAAVAPGEEYSGGSVGDVDGSTSTGVPAGGYRAAVPTGEEYSGGSVGDVDGSTSTGVPAGGYRAAVPPGEDYTPDIEYDDSTVPQTTAPATQTAGTTNVSDPTTDDSDDPGSEQ